jgi:hypothetical protein
MLYAIVFTIYRCGFFPQCALDEDNCADNRLDKIIRCITASKYGIHDISRTELNSHNLPRFNMPFELGIFFGAKKFGKKPQSGKVALIFDRQKYRYQEFISDLNGVDPKAHGDNPLTAITKIRNWLFTESKRSTIPGVTTLTQEYIEFRSKLPGIVKALGLDINNLSYNDFSVIVEQSVSERLN